MTLPIRIDPLPGESLNGFVRRLATRNYTTERAITGSGKYVMKPPKRTLAHISALSGVPESDLITLCTNEIPGFIGTETMGLNTRRAQFCRRCQSDPEPFTWYWSTVFACTRCRLSLTDGTTPQISLAAETIDLQRDMIAASWASLQGDQHAWKQLHRFGSLYRHARDLRADAYPLLSADAPELHAAARFPEPSQYLPSGALPAPIHPPTLALAATAFWRRAEIDTHPRHRGTVAPVIAANDTVREQIRAWSLTTEIVRRRCPIRRTDMPIADLALIHYLQAAHIDGNPAKPARPFVPRLAPAPITLNGREMAHLAAYSARRQCAHLPDHIELPQ